MGFKNSNSKKIIKRKYIIALTFAMMVLLSACQKSTQFTYEVNKNPVLEVQRVMNDLAVDYNPPVERMVIVAATLHDGNGLLQEHHLYDFSNITLYVSPGDKVVISVPDDPADSKTWNLIRNINNTSSQPFQPEVIAKKQAEVNYDRLNFLIEPEMNSETTYTLEDDLGNRFMTFRLSIAGIPE